MGDKILPALTNIVMIQKLGRKIRLFLRARRIHAFSWVVVAVIFLAIPLYQTIAQANLASASHLNQQGFQLLEQGSFSQALAVWRQAAQQYQKSGNREGQIGATLNQTIALQALGLNPRACQTLVSVIEIPAWICQPQSEGLPSDALSQLQRAIAALPQTRINLLGLTLSGDILRSLGRLRESELSLIAAQERATQQQDSTEQSRIALSRNSTLFLVANQARNRLLQTDEPSLQEQSASQLEQTLLAVIPIYQQSLAGDFTAAATINAFSFVTDFDLWFKTDAPKWLTNRLQPQFKQLEDQLYPKLSAILAERVSPSSTIDFINYQLKLAQTLLRNQSVRFKPLTTNRTVVQTLIEQSLQQSTALKSTRLQSYAIALSALLAEREQQPFKVIQSKYQQALNLAQSVQSWDLAYQWQIELARSYEKQNQIAQAEVAYRGAIDNIDRIRENLLGVNPDLQFNFLIKVEPIYRNYLRLLFTHSQPNLQEIVGVNQSLQIAQLENYLGCGTILARNTINQLQSDSSNPIIIHILQLPDQIKTVVQSKSKFSVYTSDRTTVQTSVDNLLSNIQDPGFRQTNANISVIPYAQSLYQQVLKPAQDAGLLPKGSTLVFVVDTILQNVPLGLLHNGSQFLIETNPISIAASSQIPKGTKLAADRMSALIAGLSKQSPSFSDPRAPQGLAALPEVEFEVEAISKQLTRTTQLLNDQFTSSRLQSEIQSSTQPILHITTHGQFSSDPQQTLLVAWDRLIDTNDLNRLFRTSVQPRRTPLKLLVLSACQSAKGDRRSTLGIAGIATQAGAESTVATLWLVDAESTGVLMKEFYQNLRAGLSKSESLRQSQITLLKSDVFQHPYFWGTFTLIGNPS